MALGTVTHVKQGVLGDLRYVIADVNVTSGANYTTGGETFTPDSLRRTGTILGVIQLGGGANAANQVIVKYDTVNKKLMAFGATDATSVGLIERAASVDLSSAANIVRLLVLLK